MKLFLLSSLGATFLLAFQVDGTAVRGSARNALEEVDCITPGGFCPTKEAYIEGHVGRRAEAPNQVQHRRAGGSEKVEVCHIPPGNTGNFHTITISENAVDAHLKHGDKLGACDAFCDELCTDGDLCTVDYLGSCNDNGCSSTPRPAVICDDHIDCTVDTCDPDLGCMFDDSACGVEITEAGEAYGHHGACNGWNDCGDAATCALGACRDHGYSTLVSYGHSQECTKFDVCHLFYYVNSNVCTVQYNWGNWCNVMGVTDIVCADLDQEDCVYDGP